MLLLLSVHNHYNEKNHICATDILGEEGKWRVSDKSACMYTVLQSTM
jgi:hypothetical protein